MGEDLIEVDDEGYGIDEMTEEELRINLRAAMKQLEDAENERHEIEEDDEDRQRLILSWMRWRGWGHIADALENKDYRGFDPETGSFR